MFSSCTSSNALGGDDIVQSFQLSAEKVKIIRSARILDMDEQVEISVHALGTMHVAIIISAPFDRAERAQKRALNVVKDGFQLALNT